MKYYYLSTILGLGFLFSSCAKHQGDVEENIPVATIRFANPVQGAVYLASDSVLIQGTAISTATIHGYDLIIKRADDTASLYRQKIHDHNDTLLIARKWKPQSELSGQMEASVILYLDHEGHTKIQKVGFAIH